MSESLKLYFARTLADTISLNMNECMVYGMMSGCDLDCPVFSRGECENGVSVLEMFAEDGLSEEIPNELVVHYLKQNGGVE